MTRGDPCGVGPEILLKALPQIAGKAQVTIYGSAAGLALLPKGGVEYALDGGKLCVGSLKIDWMDPTPDMPLEGFQIGVPCAASGKCAVEAVRRAVSDIQAGAADALLTLPLSKAVADIPGHTELLQRLTGSPRAQMAFVSPRLKVVLHTTHKSLRSAIETLNAEAVADTLIFTAEQFASMYKNDRIRIGLAAVNPHAGDAGRFGDEEALLEESIELARRHFSGSSAARPVFSGPHPADAIFPRALRGDFDVVVALYHDQGLIPIKLLEPERAVNLTLGLPFIRTSPAHGTAFDIAGKWVANPSNTIKAAELALSLMR
jgi:4-hydroxythreonine-4-phosphate dehydrogenase